MGKPGAVTWHIESVTLLLRQLTCARGPPLPLDRGLFLGAPHCMALCHPICNGPFRSHSREVSCGLTHGLKWSPVASQNSHLKES